jgi:hypothetical protein
MVRWIFFFGLIFFVFRILVRRIKAEQDRAASSPDRFRRRPYLPQEPGPEIQGNDFRRPHWRAFADSLGLTLQQNSEITGDFRSTEVKIRFETHGEDFTLAEVRLPSAAQGRVRVVPADRAEADPDLVTTDSAEFDADFRTTCRWPAFARKVLTRKTQLWLTALGDAELSVSASTVVARTRTVEVEEDRLRALLELVVEAATSASA